MKLEIHLQNEMGWSTGGNSILSFWKERRAIWVLKQPVSDNSNIWIKRLHHSLNYNIQLLKDVCFYEEICRVSSIVPMTKICERLLNRLVSVWMWKTGWRLQVLQKKATLYKCFYNTVLTRGKYLCLSSKVSWSWEVRNGRHSTFSFLLLSKKHI